jgi:hypothetical protein
MRAASRLALLRKEQQREFALNGFSLSGSDEWYTPARYVEAARQVLGGIDLDPASNKFAQKVVKAARFFTAEDGLKQQWQGRVWLNPPYSRDLMEPFVNKLCASRGVTAAILLTHNGTDSAWFETAIKHWCGALFCAGPHRILQRENRYGRLDSA